jgi:DNA-binding CsgD family transcriptional regulator
MRQSPAYSDPKPAAWGRDRVYDSREQAISERETEIVELVARGLTNQEIAQVLTISKRTVDNHVSNIFTKTGAKNRVALLNWAMDHGKICRDGFNCCDIDTSHPLAPKS